MAENLRLDRSPGDLGETPNALAWKYSNKMTFYWSTIHKNSEREIGVKPEDPKSKTTSQWLLPQPQSEVSILCPRISEWDCVWELPPPTSVLYSFLEFGLKACTTGIKGMHCPISRQLVWLLGLKTRCYDYLVCKTDQWYYSTFWSSIKLDLLK